MTIEKVTLGCGCFWCSEAVFRQLSGVTDVFPGYSGGRVVDPTYKQVCSGTTEHAEVLQIEFDSSLISFKQLLAVFFATHDPTTLNRQGADRGTQYRSVVFYHDEQQKIETEQFIERLNKDQQWADPVVTEVKPIDIFYIAEPYHHDYYTANSGQGYCVSVIEPKLAKLRKDFNL
ncbi:MAG: peptide-methionine (S)-S-oxide reductase MsrA [Mycoplasmataceae bacterium]|nr:peptide-methionine (S)-S-oxide reductase MsrA [Mycoplasmataceae bacterium]